MESKATLESKIITMYATISAAENAINSLKWDMDCLENEKKEILDKKGTEDFDEEQYLRVCVKLSVYEKIFNLLSNDLWEVITR